MTEPNQQVGAAILWSPARGLGVISVVGFPSTEAERTKAARQTARISLLLKKPSDAQTALLRHLAQTSPNGQYVVPTWQWVDAVMKAVAGLKEADIESIRDLDWTPREISPAKLRRTVLDALKSK